MKDLKSSFAQAIRAWAIFAGIILFTWFLSIISGPTDTAGFLILAYYISCPIAGIIISRYLCSQGNILFWISPLIFAALIAIYQPIKFTVMDINNALPTALLSYIGIIITVIVKYIKKKFAKND